MQRMQQHPQQNRKKLFMQTYVVVKKQKLHRIVMAPIAPYEICRFKLSKISQWRLINKKDKHMTTMTQQESPLETDKTVALDAFHREHGAKMVSFANYLMPLHYADGILNEHLHVREHAGLFDVSHMGAIHIDGPDCAQHLEKLIPADLQDLTPGKVAYGLLLNTDGGIADDLLITRLENGFLLVVNAGGKFEDLAYLQKNLPTDFTITPAFSKAIFALQGPKSASVMAQILPETAELNFMTAVSCELEGHYLWVSRTGYTGEDGFEIILDADDAHDFAALLLQFDDVKLIGLGARDSLRLEAGLCLYGHELTAAITPVQANLSWAIGKRRRQEGGFMGSSVICAEMTQGPSHKRIGLIINDRAIAREGATIHLSNGTAIGHITSGVHSPSLGVPIAMGYVEAEHIDADLLVNIRGQLRPATRSKLPFVPHNYHK